MTDLPRPRDWPEGLPVPDAWLRFDEGGELDAHGWVVPPGAAPQITLGGFRFPRVLSEEERAALAAYLSAESRLI